ncbi:MAG: ABC transporter ATP-binding protein [Clostridia bacterium]|nr:ABC transporter ATP-binding protein [Clostridia bacterium]
MVRVEQLVKRYGSLLALDYFNLEVEEGEIFGLLGPNGSGKTTAILCMLALLHYSKGSVYLFDQKMTPDAYDLKRNIGIVTQNVAVFDELTVRENIGYFCGLYVQDKKQRRALVDEAIDFVELQAFSRFYPKKLSSGLLRRLNIACGIAHRPKLIFMDEPTVGVDPQSRNKILEGILTLNRQGATILYTSHYMEEVEQICSRVAIMDNGRVIASGTCDELKDMIRTGEKITIEVSNLNPEIASDIARLPGILSAKIQNQHLYIVSERKRNTLDLILDDLKNHQIDYGELFCELPTLNDVFLEITGKQLRDNGREGS